MCKSKILIFITYFMWCSPQKINKNINETECVLDLIDIAKQYFKDRNCVTIIEVTSSDIPHVFYHIFLQPKKILKIYEKDYNVSYDLKFRPRRDDIFPDGIIPDFCQENEEGFLISAPDFDTLKSYFFGAKVSPLLSAQNKFLIMFQNSTNQQQYEQMYKEIWRIFRITTVVIIDLNCEVHFSNPFVEHQKSWGQIHTVSSTAVKLNPELIDNRVMKLNGYPFKSIVFISLMAYKTFENKTYVNYGGMDGLLLDVLQKSMNFTKILLLNIPDANYGQKLPNGSFDGALKHLVEGNIEFISVSYFLKDYLTRDVEFSEVGMQDDLCVILHRAEKIPIWAIFYVYYDVWLILCCTYFVIASIWTLIQKTESHFNNKKDYSDFIFLDTFRLMIANSFPRMPVITSEKIFLVFCMMAMVTFLGAFQGSLMTVFSTPSFYPEIKTLEQVSRTGYPIYTRFEAIKSDVFGDDTTNPVIVKLREMVKIKKATMDTDYMITKYGNCAGLSRRSSLEIDPSKVRYYDSFGNDIIYLVDECPRAYSLAYILTKKSVFSPRINDLILRTSQGGFFFKWYKDMVRNTTLATRQARLDQIATANESKHKKFAIEDLIIGFYVIFIGYIVSSIVLIVEILLCKCSNKKLINK